ncbi:MAG: hypothetical protein QOJ65_1718 [Fimbriimonadaceae bacterium]|jgi:YHS domain-containing protein|nr:hypothetical protein [Fimbriimonadaceae bacterium]
MITTLIAFTLLSPAAQAVHLACPVTGEEIGKPFASINYKGARYDLCCGGCPGPFLKNPEKFLTPEKTKSATFGVGYFDPVSGLGVKADKAEAGPSVYNRVAYYFNSNEDKTTFDADPKKYTAIPAKEALYCPVMKREVSDISKSGGYADVDGVRYYICCGDCAGELKASPSKYLNADSAKHVHDVVAVKAVKKSG